MKKLFTKLLTNNFVVFSMLFITASLLSGSGSTQESSENILLGVAYVAIVLASYFLILSFFSSYGTRSKLWMRNLFKLLMVLLIVSNAYFIWH